MKTPLSNPEGGNVLIMSLATILILSMIGANVLGNLTTRYNVSNTQVRGWKQAQHAAEAAADIAYAEVRKKVLAPLTAFDGWTQDGASYTSPVTTFGDANLMASATVEPLDASVFDPGANSNGATWYRIRAKGTVPLQGLKRVTMDSRMNIETRGDSLLRKIDFNYDHFVANYGPKGDGVDKRLVAVDYPQITRRLELIAAPVTPFHAAIKASGTFYGLGSAAYIDSYDSTPGPLPGATPKPYVFVANNKDDPRYGDSQSGHVQIGTKVATVMGTIYGDLATNGGTVLRSTYVTGAVDNNVPFSLPDFPMPDMPLRETSGPSNINGTVSLTPPYNPRTNGSSAAVPVFYEFSSWGTDGKLTVNRSINPDGNPVETYVAMRVRNDFRGAITVNPGVHVQIFFDGNMVIKQASDLNNLTGYSGNLQIYGISPPRLPAPAPPTYQTISISPPGNFSAVIYAPSADYQMNGNPDIKGALVCHNFYGNGNTKWSYDRRLDNEGRAVDYKVASYVEDIR